MIERGLVITGSDAELLSRALSEVNTKAYEESETQLDNTQALNALVSGFRSAESDGHEKEGVTRILAPYASAWCSARLSIGKAARNSYKSSSLST